MAGDPWCERIRESVAPRPTGGLQAQPLERSGRILLQDTPEHEPPLAGPRPQIQLATGPPQIRAGEDHSAADGAQQGAHELVGALVSRIRDARRLPQVKR